MFRPIGMQEWQLPPLASGIAMSKGRGADAYLP